MVEHITPNDKMTVRFGHSLFYTIITWGNYEQDIRIKNCKTRKNDENSKSVKNEVTDPFATAIYRSADSIKQIVNN